MAQTTGDLERIIQWVSDAKYGYTDTAETTLANEMDRRLAAETQLTAANQRAEGLDKALTKARVEGSLKMKADAVNACYDRADQINAIGVMGECCAATANNCADDILSIPADMSAPVKVAECPECKRRLDWHVANFKDRVAGGRDE
jgi:hypothetical protein